MLLHDELVPPEDVTDREDPRLKDSKTEFDVHQALLKLGHEVKVVGLTDDITPI